MSVATQGRTAAISAVEAAAYTIPTDAPESDGTLEWNETTVVVVELVAEGERGLGYTYADASVAQLADSLLRPVVEGADPMSPGAAAKRMRAALRNAGQPGAGAMAVSAVDIALWDLKAKLLGLPLADALPRVHQHVGVYGSGGFTSYGDERLREQLAGWAAAGIGAVKMKVGRHPEEDEHRVAVAREAVGREVELMVDANGAHAPAEAIDWAWRFAAHDIGYFEEPVSSEDATGLRRVRDAAPPGMAIAAGEYCWSPLDAARLIEAGAVDILQADVTRCGGVSGLLEIAALAAASRLPFSAHCAPAVSVHACCAVDTLRHLEYFHDHVRVESMLFDGVVEPHAGRLVPSASVPGHGLALRAAAQEWRAP